LHPLVTCIIVIPSGYLYPPNYNCPLIVILSKAKDLGQHKHSAGYLPLINRTTADPVMLSLRLIHFYGLFGFFR
jgi:hypothetical protein